MTTSHTIAEQVETLEQRIERETQHFMKKITDHNFNPKDAFAAILERVIKETERASVASFKNALIQISQLDPEVDSTATNEWAQADCFTKAQKIAQETLTPSIKNNLKIK